MDICNWNDEKYIERSAKKLRRLGNYDGIIFDKEYNYGATYYMPISAKKQCKIIKQENVDIRIEEEDG